MDISDEALKRVETLTPRQRDCLRLVGRLHESKDIAALLGISEGRVDKHITEAMRRLGVSRRNEAARLVQAYEARFSPVRTGAQQLGAQSPGLVESGHPLLAPAAHESAREGSEDHEAKAATDRKRSDPTPLITVPPDLLPRRVGGRLAHDMTLFRLSRAIATIALIGAVAASATVSLLQMFDRLAAELLHF